MNSNDIKVSSTNYKTFFAIALRSQARIDELMKDLSEFSRRPRSDQDIDTTCERDADIKRHGMIAVVFSAMTLESFINHYGIKHSSMNFFVRYIDHLNLEGKWLILPRIVTQKTIDTDSQAFELFCKLMKLRNRLVHDKTIVKRLGEDSDWVTEEDANIAIGAVRGMMGALHALDQTVETGWLNEVGRDPYA